MKIIVTLIVFIYLLSGVSVLNRHVKPEIITTYEDTEILAGALVMGIILLAFVTLLFIFS